MRATFAWSASETSVLCASFRLVLVSFDVRMWRIFDWPRNILPVPVFLKRLAAPLCVFSLGMVFLLGICLFTASSSIRDWADLDQLKPIVGSGLSLFLPPRRFKNLTTLLAAYQMTELAATATTKEA